jgi:protein disulfide isomerase family A protein 3
LKNEDSIVIAKMDITTNEVPVKYNLKSWLTIFFAPKNAKNSPRKYGGAREVDELIKYLAREATDPLKGYDRDGNKLKRKTEL